MRSIQPVARIVLTRRTGRRRCQGNRPERLASKVRSGGSPPNAHRIRSSAMIWIKRSWSQSRTHSNRILSPQRSVPHPQRQNDHDHDEPRRGQEREGVGHFPSMLTELSEDLVKRRGDGRFRAEQNRLASPAERQWSTSAIIAAISPKVASQPTVPITSSTMHSVSDCFGWSCDYEEHAGPTSVKKRRYHQRGS